MKNSGLVMSGQQIPGERPTLKTIAFMTGLGVTTVSRALKDAPDIGAETKERVRLVADQIGYQPNRAGVRLRTGKTNVISLILAMDEEMMGLTSHIVFGISEVLASTSYTLVLTPYARDKDPMLPVRHILETASADGVILSSTEPDDPRIRLLTERNLPFATHGRTRMGIVHPYHDFDNAAYALEAVRRLAARGRKRLALLKPPSKLTYCQHMQDGFRRGIAEAGIGEAAFDEIDITAPLEQIHLAAMRLMASPDAPDGIVCGSAASAVAVATAVETSGRKLGRDVDMVSKQPANLLRWFRPEIMTVNEDIHLAGRELAKAVLARIDGVPAEQLRTICLPDGRLVRDES